MGPYRIERSIGHGGMGEVYQGYDERLDRPVALKRIKSERAGAESRKRFRREAQAIARVSHSAIVQVHDWVEDDTGAWIVMELVEGRSLRDVLGQGLGLGQALELARDVAAGLAVAHGAGVVHRDLKPENIMVSESGGAKILDFGLAKRDPVQGRESSLTVEGKILGTFTAMSPEQAMGREVSHRSDLFSLGSLIYEMVTGVSPFRGQGPMETLTRICTEKQVPAQQLNGAVTDDLSSLIDRLLSKDPALRPEDASVVCDALGAMIRRTPTRAGAAAVAPGMAMSAATMVQTVETVEPGAVGGVEPTVTQAGAADETQSNDTRAYTSSSNPPWSRLIAVALVVAALVSLYVLAPRGGDSGGAAASIQTGAAERALEAMDEHELFDFAQEKLERYDKKGNLGRGIEALELLLTKNPESAPGHALLALAYHYLPLQGGNDANWLRKAEQAAERAVELDPYLAKARVGRGFVYQDLGRPEEALKDLRIALELDPESDWARIGLARVLASQGELEQAKKVVAKGSRLNPDSWKLHLEIGSLFFRTGRYETAAASFEEVVRLVPDSILGYRNLSGAYYFLGDLAKASAVLQRAIEIEPKATLYNNLGTFYFMQGLFTESVAAFEHVQVLAADGSDDYRLWANLADAYRWAPGLGEKAPGAYDKALEILGRELAARPEDNLLRSRRALYLAKRGDCETAAVELGSLEGVSRDDAQAHYRRAVALEVCGRRERAIEALGVALDAGYAVLNVERDPELNSLRQEPEYQRLVAEL